MGKPMCFFFSKRKISTENIPSNFRIHFTVVGQHETYKTKINARTHIGTSEKVRYLTVS